jgi:protocatechuate 3,4-dioxygenase, beta subunit
MNSNNLFLTRRHFLSAGVAIGVVGTGAIFTPGVFAQKLIQTPRQTEGPFYPDKLPLDTDNDLLIINDAITPAVGAVTYLSGRILDSRGEPIRNAFVEIWQCDNNGAYLHAKTVNRDKRDLPGFRTFPDRLDGRISVPHHQARSLPRPHAAHPFRR